MALCVQCTYLVTVFVILSSVSTFILEDLMIPVDRSIPRIRPLRRQIRHFEPGKLGQITVIYQTTHADDIKIRWFRKAVDLANAEISDHLTIEGDPRYSLKFLAISDVRAVTLRVADVALWEFPMSFVLVMTIGHPAAIEYQLDTVIEEPLPFTYDDILDEIRWVALPPSPLTFSYHGSMSATCVAVLDSESEIITDELNMYRVTFERDKSRLKKGLLSQGVHQEMETEVGNILSVGVGQIHKARNNYAEESGAYITIGSRTELPLKYYRYEVTVRVYNATKKDQGAYACSMERQQDRMFASSWIREGHPHRRPSLELIACENDAMTKRRRDLTSGYHYRIRLSVGRETCVRCRAYGYPPPDLRLSKDGRGVLSDVKHDVDVHLNVADGGLRELTYSLRRPTYTDSGSYICHARHRGGEETLSFKLEVK